MSKSSTSMYSGLISSTVASCFFALLPWYVHQYPVTEQSGTILGAQRIIWSTVILLLSLAISGQLPVFIRYLKNWQAWPRVFLGSLLVGVQFWVFLWAPANDQTLSLALGYFSLPLTLVLAGRFFYQEVLNRWQWFAVVLAGLGVAYAYIKADGLSWIVLVVALGYPPFFMLRRKYPLPSHVALTFDNLLLLPIALVYVYFIQNTSTDIIQPPWFYYLGLGIIGTVPMLLFLIASRSLPLSIFGLMTYLEPVLVFCVGWLLGERIDAQQWPTYILIIMALMVLTLNGIRWRKKEH